MMARSIHMRDLVRQLHRRGVGFGELGAIERYRPIASQIAGSPKAGAFYRVVKGDTVWAISKSAYGGGVKNGIYAIAGSSWNRHIEYGRSGYESYQIDGPQLNPKYAADPLSERGSGSGYPVLWIPPLDTRYEPETVYGSPYVVGPQGPAGSPGLPGQGLPGPAGPQGPAGGMGPAGPAGPVGSRGAIGPQGPAGAIGPIGPPGSASDKAIEAAVSDWLARNPLKAGPAGPPGPAGAMGPIGPMGPAGPRGSGSAGPAGGMGPIGPAGPPGAQGPTGAPGSASDEAIGAAVRQWLANHPVEAPRVSDAVIAAAVAQWMIAHPQAAGSSPAAGGGGTSGGLGILPLGLISAVASRF